MTLQIILSSFRYSFVDIPLEEEINGQSVSLSEKQSSDSSRSNQSQEVNNGEVNPTKRRSKRNLWRRNKRRDVPEQSVLNRTFEYPPDHVSDGRLLGVYKKLNKKCNEFFSEWKNDLINELDVYQSLTELISSGVKETSVDLSSYVHYSSNEGVCDGCPYQSSSHSFSSSTKPIRIFREGKEIPYVKSTFTSIEYSVTAICVTT